jgi:hypothetical protein
VALAELPGDLQDTYENAMKRIEDQNEDWKLAHSVLTWVANAKRLLTVSELQTALAIEPDTRELDRDNINLLDIETILSVCTGLVIVDQQLSVVRLVDYTTQEYLDGIRAQRFPRAQTDITRSVLTYLTFTDLLWTYPESWDVSRTHLVASMRSRPMLFEYCQFCLAHARGQSEGQLRRMILDFLGRASALQLGIGPRWQTPPWDFPDWPEHPSPLDRGRSKPSRDFKVPVGRGNLFPSFLHH